MYRLLAVILTSFVLFGCMSNQVKSFKDSEFLNRKVNTVLLDTDSLPSFIKSELDPILVEALSDKQIKTLTIDDVLPPTRSYSTEQKITQIDNSGADSILRIVLRDSFEDIRITGTYNYLSGSARTYGNNTSFNASGFSTPIGRAQSKHFFTVVLYDVSSGKKIWVADITIEAGGTAFVGRNDKLADSLVEAIIVNLVSDKLI